MNIDRSARRMGLFIKANEIAIEEGAKRQCGSAAPGARFGEILAPALQRRSQDEGGESWGRKPQRKPRKRPRPTATSLPAKNLRHRSRKRPSRLHKPLQSRQRLAKVILLKWGSQAKSPNMTMSPESRRTRMQSQSYPPATRNENWVCILQVLASFI